jgi:hypothetical protein
LVAKDELNVGQSSGCHQLKFNIPETHFISQKSTIPGNF